jgi:hypothetical protein
MLEQHLAVAVPGVAHDDAMLTLLGHFVPSLLAVAQIAEAAAKHWGAKKWREKQPDNARRLLMSRLCKIYSDMFGREATVSMAPQPDIRLGQRSHEPSGPAFEWFMLFFSRPEQVLAALPGDNPAAGALAQIAHAAGASRVGDAVTDWLSEARRG